MFWLLQKVHFPLFDFALSSFVTRLTVQKLLDIKRSLSLFLVTCPFDSLCSYLEHCPLSHSLATTWKQVFKPNFISILEHLHFCVTIPFINYFQNPGTDLELLVPTENRVKKAYHPLKVQTLSPKVDFSLPFLVTTILNTSWLVWTKAYLYREPEV